MKAASVIMCAALIGTCVPVASVMALSSESITEKQAENAVDAASIGKISIFYNGTEVPVEIDRTASLETFVSQILELAAISDDANDVRLDWVDADGLRTRLLPYANIDDETADDAIQTVLDLYALAEGQEDKITLVVFNDSCEIIRLTLGLADIAGTLAVDVVKGSPDTTYLVRYYANGGVLENTNTVLRAKGEAISYIENSATYENHTFAGWYDAKEGGSEVTEETIVNADLGVYAHWTVNTYQLNFDSQGGSDVEPQTVSCDDTVRTLPEPTRAGYTFLGWYDAKEGGNKVTAVSMDKDMTLYAQWKVATYTVTLDDQNGNVSTVTMDSSTVFDAFTIPVKEGYTFLGWYDAKTGGKKVVSYNGDEDATFYAQWEQTAAAPGTSDNSNSTTSNGASETAQRYTLTVISSSGTASRVIVNENVELNTLTKKLGYDVSAYTLKTATVTEHAIAGTTTMETIANLAEKGDVAIIGYDSNNKALGSAKIIKTADNTFLVSLSKDTNVDPGTSDGSSADGKGKGEGVAEETPVSNSGKKDVVASQVKTSDTSVLPVYVTLGGVMVVLLGVLGVLRKKRIK